MTQAQATTDFVSLKDFRAAAERIAPVARITPLVDVSGPAGRPFFLKCESLQPAGAFKIRGAYNMVAQLNPAQREAGVITYSSGNHGQAMALAARTLGVRAVVVMPTTAPQVKIDGARAFGAEVIFAGTTSADRRDAGGSRSRKPRTDDGAAVRSRVDHCRSRDGRARNPRSVPERRRSARANRRRRPRSRRRGRDQAVAA